MKYRVLAITDHSKHVSENAIYPILKALYKEDRVNQIDLLSRGIAENQYFFKNPGKAKFKVTKVNSDFAFTEDGIFYSKGLQESSLEGYDIILMRLPRPVEDNFLIELDKATKHKVVLNHPLGILKTSTKAFLQNFKEVCPEFKLCHSIAEVKEFTKKYEVVLKPLKEYGGKGIVRIKNEIVDREGQNISLDTYLETIKEEIEKEGVMLMKFLKNVNRGDKRIIVVDGQILGASLRTPKEGGWLCNISQGGSSMACEVEIEETEMVEIINPILQKEGVFLYGLDTLVNDDNKRVLSEINTLSIGGFHRCNDLNGVPIVQIAAKKIVDYSDKFYGSRN